MLRRKILFVVILALASLEVKAQYDVPFSHYWAMEPYFNPGAVGKEAKINVTAAYAMNFVGFENNPRTMYLAGVYYIDFVSFVISNLDLIVYSIE